MSRANLEQHDGAGELNLVPYLDIMVNLVVFLIFTMQVVVETNVIELMAPAQCASCSGLGGAAAATLVISGEGYALRTDDPELVPINLPRVDGHYDTGALSAALSRWQATGRFDQTLTLVASGEIHYDVIVAAMDAARKDGDQVLFPSVKLARMGS